MFVINAFTPSKKIYRIWEEFEFVERCITNRNWLRSYKWTFTTVTTLKVDDMLFKF